MELPNLVACIFGFASFIVAMVDATWVRKHYFPAAYKRNIRQLVSHAGIFSLANALAAVAPGSSVLFADVATVCRVSWSYHYLVLLLSNFNPMGQGGEEENVYAAGKILDDVEITTPLKYFPGCILCTGTYTFIPSSKWLKSCVLRVRQFILFTVLLVIVRQVLSDHDLLFDGDGKPKLAQDILTYVGVYMVFLGLSGFLPVLSVIVPLVLPNRRDLVVFRSALFRFFFSWVGGLQPLVFSLCGTTENVTFAVVAVEMFIFQLCCHKAFVPMFEWSYPPRSMSRVDFDEALANGFQFLVPQEDMAKIIEKTVKDDERKPSISLNESEQGLVLEMEDNCEFKKELDSSV